MTESASITPLSVAAKPAVSFVAVDPQIAARWLAGNEGNRNIRPPQVNKWEREMREGRWTLNNDAICFAPDGRLLNGQHRLTAVVASGAAVVLLVIRNMPLDAMINMDTGSARTAGDVLHYDGETRTSLLASVGKQCLLISTGRIYQDSAVQHPTHGEIRDFITEHPEIRAATEAASRHRGVDATPTAVGAAFWVISNAAGQMYADHYFTQIVSRHDEPAGSAVLAVDSRLRQVRRTGVRVSPRQYVYLLVKGWNHYARDSRVRTLSLSPKDKFRIPSPIRWQR